MTARKLVWLEQNDQGDVEQNKEREEIGSRLYRAIKQSSTKVHIPKKVPNPRGYTAIIPHIMWLLSEIRFQIGFPQTGILQNLLPSNKPIGHFLIPSGEKQQIPSWKPSLRSEATPPCPRCPPEQDPERTTASRAPSFLPFAEERARAPPTCGATELPGAPEPGPLAPPPGLAAATPHPPPPARPRAPGRSAPAPAVAPRACSGPAPSAGPGTCPASSGFPHRPREAPRRRFPAPGARPATPAHPASSPPLSGTRSSPRLRPARSASASRCCPGSRRPPADPSPWRRCVRGAPPGTPRECEPCGPAV
uniref:basic proline-rich protein-like n=1 Tax=Nyctereutes procyonoides TaxID=34880 RepID=UPI002444A99D|nr:basic proline-rich protein-like [Nyctereutes procyonoides]